MSEPTLSCYEIYLKGVDNGNLVLISLPPSMGSRFKTTDPTPPSNSFIYSLISKKDVSDNILSIREYNFYLDWTKSFVRDKIIRKIIETGTYTIDYKKINCDDKPDTIKGDPSNADKPYPSVSDEDTPPNKDGDPSNPDDKCHFADFTITIVIGGLVSRRIRVKLRTNQNPLPAPIDSSLKDKETIIQYIQSVGGQKIAEQISDSIGVGTILSIDWDGDFWKPCAEKDDPNDPNEPDPQANKSVCIKRPKTIRMGDLSQIGDEEATYCAKLDGVTTSNVLRITGLKNKIEDYVDPNSLKNPLNFLSPNSLPGGDNQKIIDMLNINAESINMFATLSAGQWLRNRKIQIVGHMEYDKGTNPPDNTPDNITITLKIDTILNYEFYFIGDPPRPRTAQLIDTSAPQNTNEELLETIELETAEKIDNEFTGKPGIDFEKVWKVVRDKIMLKIFNGPIIGKDNYIKRPKVLNKDFKISLPISGQPFTLDLKKTSTTIDSSGRVTEVRKVIYELSLDDDSDDAMNRLIYELKKVLKDNSPKIFGEMLKIVYGDEDAEPGPFDPNPEDRNVIKQYLDQVVDTCRGILISKANKATKASKKNPGCIHLEFPPGDLELELFNLKVSFSKPK